MSRWRDPGPRLIAAAGPLMLPAPLRAGRTRDPPMEVWNPTLSHSGLGRTYGHQHTRLSILDHLRARGKPGADHWALVAGTDRGGDRLSRGFRSRVLWNRPQWRIIAETKRGDRVSSLSFPPLGGGVTGASAAHQRHLAPAGYPMLRQPV